MNFMKLGYEVTAVDGAKELAKKASVLLGKEVIVSTFEELKSHDNFKQTSYVYVAHVIKDTKELHFTQKEIDEGAKLLWLNIEDAMKLIKDSEDKLIASKYENVYHTKFIARRDYEILRYYINHCK